jgi:hypothetical protein
LILLLVAFGMINICLGFGLAMYYGLGPPGLDGIFEAIGPMPPGAPGGQSLVSGVLDAADGSFAAAPSSESATLDEEQVLGDVRDLSDTAQTALAGESVEN